MKKLLEAIKVDGKLYYFDPDPFGQTNPGDPCINLNGDGLGRLLATVKNYQPMTSGAMYKIWACSDPSSGFIKIPVAEVIEYDTETYSLVEIELDDREMITGPEKGHMIKNPMRGTPMSYSGYIRVLAKHRGVQIPFNIFDVSPYTTAYKFLTDGGFSMLDNGNHIFVIQGVGYRFPPQIPVCSSLDMDALLKHMACGSFKVRSKVPIQGATSHIGIVQELKILNEKNRGCGVKFPGLNYNTWFHDSDGTDKRTKYMRDLEIYLSDEE